MSKFASVETFSANLIEEFNWRIKEISDVRKVASSTSQGYEIPLRKAGLALVYAHWEGYVKYVVEAYIKFIAVRKFRFTILSEEFLAVEVGSVLRKYMKSAGGFSQRVSFVSEFKALEAAQFKSFHDKVINTGGNLNFERFSAICSIMKIEPNKIVSNESYLDERILGVRNKIAHGVSITVSETELTQASDFVIEAMRSFRTETENLLLSKSYLREKAA